MLLADGDNQSDREKWQVPKYIARKLYYISKRNKNMRVLLAVHTLLLSVFIVVLLLAT